MPEHLELPRPLRLLRTMAWSLSESAGIPIAALAIAAWLGGRDAGLLAGLAATWMIVVIRKLATESVPGLLAISAIVLTVQTAAVIATGNLWIFLLHFPLANLGLCLLFVRTARGRSPIAARLAAEVIGLRCPVVHQQRMHRFFQNVTVLWGGVFLLLSAVATIALIVAGTAASMLWFRSVLRRLGLRLRFAPA